MLERSDSISRMRDLKQVETRLPAGQGFYAPIRSGLRMTEYAYVSL